LLAILVGIGGNLHRPPQSVNLSLL